MQVSKEKKAPFYNVHPLNLSILEMALKKYINNC